MHHWLAANKQPKFLNNLQKIINKKPVQYGLLVLWLTVVLWIFVNHFIHSTPLFVDERLITNCRHVLNIYTVVIDETGFTPNQINASICDQVIFINRGSLPHQVAFGPHPFHLIYPDYKEKLLSPNQMNSLLLKASGTYYLHDHYNEKLEFKLIIPM